MTASASRRSARINKANVKNLKLAYAVPLGGTAGMEVIDATPLVEDGFLYIIDGWGVLYKIDGSSGDAGRIVWRMEPKQEQQATNRGAALWGNLVITAANYPARIIATDKETGKVAWETNMVFGDAGAAPDQRAARHQGQDHRGRGRGRSRRARLDRRARCRDRQGAVAQVHHSGARRARQRDLEGQHQRLADRRRRDVGDRDLRSRNQPDHLGHRQSGADVRPVLPTGRQPLHQQRDLLGSATPAR